MRIVFISFHYRLFTAHAKRSCPHRSDRKKREENEFLFLFFSQRILHIIQIRGKNFFFSSLLHLPSLSLFYRPPREILANQNSIDSQRLCLASPTINVKFRDAKTGTNVALSGSGFRWKREYLHVYSNSRFRREWSADLEGKGWKNY